jgi:hypothetical protein
MNHLSRVRESHSITATVRNDDGARRFVRFVARPVALKLQKHLYPTSEARAGLLEPAKRELVTGRRESAARIRYNEDFKSIFKGTEHGEGDTSFGEESRDDQPLSLNTNNRVSSRVILPNVHTFAFDRLYGGKGFLQGWKQRTAVNTRCGSRCDLPIHRHRLADAFLLGYCSPRLG